MKSKSTSLCIEETLLDAINRKRLVRNNVIFLALARFQPEHFRARPRAPHKVVRILINPELEKISQGLLDKLPGVNRSQLINAALEEYLLEEKQ